MVVVEGAGPASCVVSGLGLLGGGVYACVFELLVRAVRRVEGSGPGGGMIEGGVREAPPVLSTCTGWSRRSLPPVWCIAHGVGDW